MNHFKLRDYQLEIDSAARAALREPGVQSVLIVSPTGSGKTAIFTNIARGAAVKGNSVFILVHRSELLDQTSKALTRQGVPHGIIAPGVPETNDLVQVVMVATFKRRLNSWWRPKLLIIDECHHGVAGTWLTINNWVGPDCKIIGVTATPERLDSKGLGRQYGGIFDRMVIGPTVEYLQKTINPDTGMTYLSPAITYSLPVIADIDNVRRGKSGEFIEEDLVKAVDRPEVTGDAAEHYKRLCNGKPAVAFCASIEHAEHVAKQFNESGINAISIDGKLNDNERKRRLKLLEDGKISVLVSVALVDEGFDLPLIEVALLLAATTSVSRYIQRCGRVLRPSPGKDYAMILDFVGDVLRHGLVSQDREWSLEGRKKKKKSDSEPAPPVLQCPKCYAAFLSQDICPVCGHVFEKKQKEKDYSHADGELQIVGAREIAEAQIAAAVAANEEKKKRNTKIGRARRLDELYELAKEFGYKPAWAQHVYASRHGRDGLRLAMIEIETNARHAQAKELQRMRRAQ